MPTAAIDEASIEWLTNQIMKAGQKNVTDVLLIIATIRVFTRAQVSDAVDGGTVLLSPSAACPDLSQALCKNSTLAAIA
jgi:hypothetical protein